MALAIRHVVFVWIYACVFAMPPPTFSPFFSAQHSIPHPLVFICLDCLHAWLVGYCVWARDKTLRLCALTKIVIVVVLALRIGFIEIVLWSVNGFKPIFRRIPKGSR